MENLYLLEIKWIYKIKNRNKFLIYNIIGIIYPIIIYNGLKDQVNNTRPPSSLLLV